uniref:Uncharacterized protein n=1 Tax=Strongyloides venezuelensis TaxID=75913 RepID=A0A0K0FHG5_STRVS
MECCIRLNLCTSTLKLCRKLEDERRPHLENYIRNGSLGALEASEESTRITSSFVDPREVVITISSEKRRQMGGTK